MLSRKLAAGNDWLLAHGNHGVSRADGAGRHQVLDARPLPGVALAHFPIRSPDQLGKKDTQLADFVVNSNAVFAALAHQDANLKQTLRQLPSTLDVTQTNLAKVQRLAETLSATLGPRITADTGEWGTYAWSELVLGVPGMRVAGGTDEVMRNIVGERVLGLPKEPRADR